MATNVALASNGATATVSSTYDNDTVNYPGSAGINGSRTGATFGSGGTWGSLQYNIAGETYQVDFSGSFTINEIDVFGLQDAYTSPSTPTLSMTSSLYGMKDFDIQYWTGSAWATVTGGAITGNNHVWVQVTFSPITTTKIRILFSAMQPSAISTWLTELEAWTAPSAPGAPGSPSPADTATGVSLTPTLTWTSSGATSYDVYFGTAASPPLVSSGQASASYSPLGLAGSTAYHWKIVAINAGGSTTGSVWTFTTGAFSSTTSSKPTVFIEAELSGVGAGWTSLTSDVLRPYGVTIKWGIQGSGPGDLVAPSGSMQFALNNSARNSASLLGYYSLYNANKRSGWALGIGCRCRLQDPNTGTIYTRFTGRIDAINPEPGRYRDRAVVVNVVDWMDEAARFTIPPDIGEQIDQRADEILTSILALMPRQPVSTSFDMGTESYPIALDTSPTNTQPALAEFVKLAASEFGPIYVKGDGTLRFESRHARLLDTTNDWTITESDLQGLSLPSTRDEVINVVRVVTHPKIIDDDPTTIVYEQANVIEIAPGETKFLGGPFRDPVTGDEIGARDVHVPISGTDYTFNTAEDGTGTDIVAYLTLTTNIGPSGATFQATNTHTSSAGYLTLLRLYGRGVYDRGATTFESTDSASVSTLGELPTEFDMPYQSDDNVGTGAASYILNKYSNAFAQARRITVAADSATLLAQILTRDISDRIGISETVTGLNSNYFINGGTLRIAPSGLLSAEYVLAPAADPSAGLYWILGTSTLGTDTIPAPF